MTDHTSPLPLTLRAIRAKLIARNIAVPAHPDTSRIHQGNVMKQLRVSHQTPRTLRLDSAAS